MGTEPLSLRQSRAVQKWPCDGVVRFDVKGKSLTYSQAYDEILVVESCAQNTFTHAGLRRITLLNAAYFKMARNFIITAMIRRAKEKKVNELPRLPEKR